MNKLSNPERAKLLAAWTNALKEEKVSVWAKDNLVRNMRVIIEGTTNYTFAGDIETDVGKIYVGKLDCEEGTEVILLTVNKIGRDFVELLVYDPEEGCTLLINPFTQLRGFYEMPWIEALTTNKIEDSIDIHHSDVDKDVTYRVLNHMSKAYIGGYIIEEPETHKLHFMTLAKLKSTMKA